MSRGADTWTGRAWDRDFVPRTSERSAVLVGLALLAVLGAADWAVGPHQPLTTTYVLAPIVTGLLASARGTVRVAFVAVAAATLSAAWNHGAFGTGSLVRWAIVAAGGLLAIAGAHSRDRTRAANDRASRLSATNALLSAAVADAERRLVIALDTLDAGVMVQQPARGIIYANQATARMMGLPTPEHVVRATPEEIAAGWDAFDEEGRPLAAARYPSRRLLNGEREVPPLLVRAVEKATGQEYWRMVKARAVPGPDGELDMTVSITEDVTDLKRGATAQRVLAEGGRVLSSSLDLGTTLRQLARLCVPDVADWCQVLLPDDEGHLVRVAVAHADGGRDLGRPEYTTAATEVFRTGEALLISRLRDEPDERMSDEERRRLVRDLGVRSVLKVPIVAPGGDRLGVLSLVNAESGRSLQPSDVELAEELGRRAGMAIQNAMLHAELGNIAATLQRGLLPSPPPEMPGFRTATLYWPAGDHNLVGGDFFDVFATVRGWMAIIGDVTGQGAAAASLAARARHTLRTAGILTGDPGLALEHLNGQLLIEHEQSLCTACAVHIAEGGDGGAVLLVARGGHPEPLHVGADDVHELKVDGALLGAWPVEYAVNEVRLEPGEMLVLYTDGVTEAAGAADATERFGVTRLRGALAGACNAQDAVTRVGAALDEFGVRQQADDIAVLAIERARPA